MTVDPEATEQSYSKDVKKTIAKVKKVVKANSSNKANEECKKNSSDQNIAAQNL